MPSWRRCCVARRSPVSCEVWAREVAKRHTRRDNPASVSLARSLVTMARQADADPDASRHNLEIVAAQLRACGPSGDMVEELQAKMWARRCKALVGEAERVSDRPSS